MPISLNSNSKVPLMDLNISILEASTKQNQCSSTVTIVELKQERCVLTNLEGSERQNQHTNHWLTPAVLFVLAVSFCHLLRHVDDVRGVLESGLANSPRALPPCNVNACRK